MSVDRSEPCSVCDVASDPVLAPLAGVLDRMRLEDRGAWSGEARRQRVIELSAISERIQAELLRAIGDVDRDDAWSVDQSLTVTTWLARNGRVDAARAARLVRAARLARDVEPVGAALAAGEVRVDQVERLAMIARNREDLFERDAELLLEAARALEPREFSRVTEYWRHLADDEASTDEPAKVHARRGLHVSKTMGGTVRIDGELEPEPGGWLINALDRRARPDAADDPMGPRTLAQRQADALAEMARHDLARSAPAGRAVVGMDLVIDEDAFAGRMPVDLAALAAGRCEVVGVGPVAPETVRRLACDAAIGRALRGASAVLDLGYRTHYPTETQRRAVIIRDGDHCAVPGCDRPSRWCDLHHLVPYRPGRTDLDNLVLLCRRHHTAVHELRWRLWRGENGRYRFEPPDGGPGARRHRRGRWRSAGYGSYRARAPAGP